MNPTQIDHLSQLPIDVFIYNITFLPFTDVVSVCSANTKLRSFCNDPRYSVRWKALINNTFHQIYNYPDKLEALWKKLDLPPDTYNYLVYTQLIKLLDPITQLMIYYKQGDMESFNDPKFTNIQRFLMLFLLKKPQEMRQYLPSDNYLPFISMSSRDKISQDSLDIMLAKMSKEGSVQGVKFLVSAGANIHAQDDEALRLASEN